ncbi:MAG: glycoside hydrolase family 88 protein [Paludibacteraceae bacterium]
MKRYFLLMLILSVSIISFAVLPSKSDIISQMKLVNDYWIAQNTAPGNNQWARGAYFTGNLDFYKIYPKESYLQYALLWGNNNNWGLNGGSNTRNADNQTCGQTYIDLYNLDDTRQPNKIEAINRSINNMAYSNKSDDWWWIDALYMAMPVFTRMGVMLDDSLYFNRMYDLYTDAKVRRGLFNPATGLWYRDESFKPPYTTINGQESYWSRGNGWVIAAHARVLQLLPHTNSHRAEYIATFRQMAAALKECQRTDGFWGVSLTDPNEYSGPETSGTSFFTYALAWGINNQLLDSATYCPIVEKAWKGLTSIAVQPTGFLGYIQGVGSNPASSQPVTINSNADFGVGAFLLAGSEVVKMAAGEMPLPFNFGIKTIRTIDKNHVSVAFTKKVNVTSGVIPENYLINNSIEVISVSVGDNDSTVILNTTELDLNTYTLTVNDITSTGGEPLENGETKTFTYSGIFAVTASGYESNSSNIPENTLDFNLDTRWSCDGMGQWIMYDLGEIKNILSVDLAFFNGGTRKGFFAVHLSSDGVDFAEVYTGESSGKTNSLENYNFDDKLARYVKIIGYGNSQNTWNSITETQINWEEASSGIFNPVSERAVFYPNPLTSGEKLNIQTKDDSKENKIVIVNTLGKVVYDKTKQSVYNYLQIEDLKLQGGVYFVKLIDGQKRETSGMLMVE